MEHLIEVAFKGNRREFFRWSFEAPPPVRAAIIVDTERGEDLGRVHSTGELAERRKAGTTHGKEQQQPLRTALRLASGDDVARAGVLREEEEMARRLAVQKARALNLQMKVSDAEWQWDRRRLTFFFTAEERVDFRSLVRQLEAEFGVRVQMWHIGPRDEAKRLDGVGHCGRQLCSSTWLPELLPVKTSLAKDQRLSTITPTQISGACGRLMCCLRYEHDFYVQARKRFPKQGKIVQLLEGEEKIESTDIFRDLVTLRNPAGDLRTIPLAHFKRELAGEAVPVDDVHEDEGEEPAEERATPKAPSREHRVQVQRAQSPVATDARQSATQPAARPARSRGESRRDPRSGRDKQTAPPAAAAQPATTAQTAQPAVPRPAAPTVPAVPPRLVQPPVVPAPPTAKPSVPRPATAAPAAAADDETPGTPGASETASQPDGGSDGELRRGRRRRGRRGGRRHRGDGNHGTDGGAPNAPTHNPND